MSEGILTAEDSTAFACKAPGQTMYHVSFGAGMLCGVNKRSNRDYESVFEIDHIGDFLREEANNRYLCSRCAVALKKFIKENA